MRSVVYAALAGLVAVFAFAGPKPASALPAAAALNHAPAQASSDIVQVKKKRRNYRGYRNYRRPYYRPYSYNRRPYYRPYRSYRPYYRSYRPYYRPYYRRRPGISIRIG